MNTEEKVFKVRENRARRRLANQGYSLKKNRSKVNPYNVGGYMIINSHTNFIEAGGGYGIDYNMDLDDVENFISQ